MKKIFKYKLNVAENQYIDIHQDYEILTVDYQNNEIVMWAIVDLNSPLDSVVIDVFGTGFFIPVNYSKENYIGTVIAGRFVWHVFQKA